MPFEQVVELVQPARSLAHTPAVPGDVRVAERAEARGFGLPGLEVEPVRRGDRRMAKFDLSLQLREAGGRIAGGWSTRRRCSSGRRSSGMRATCGACWRDGRRTSSRRWTGSRCCRTAERQPAGGGVERDGGGVSARARACTSCSRRRSARTPDAVAVVYEDEHAELRRAERARQPAGAPPARLGVGPDERVAICVERVARRWWWGCWRS